MSLVAELKRRNVLKVGAAYLVVAWLLIQVAATVAPQLQLPDWAPRLITLMLLIGFPVALLLAWMLERTPEGLKVEPATVGNKRMFAIAAVLAALALGWYFRAAIPGGTATPVHPRIAVLPLANFSPDPDNAFFADGLHDDMLTALSRLQGVDVISRTTMQTFRQSPLTLAEIARKIGATHVIEGSVRRDDVRVRLTIQLIDAGTDDHLWAETYDRPLTDALTLQTAVATEVAQALKVAIAGGAGGAPPTLAPAAYDLYLKARLTPNELDQLKLLDSALLLDPKFTLARTARAASACLALWYDGTRRAELAAQARADIDRARLERPELPEIQIAEGHYVYRVLRDYPAALAIVDKALVIRPNDVDALMLRAYLLRRLARDEEAIAALRRALELEPTNPVVVSINGELLNYFGRHREAIKLLDAAVASGAPGMAEAVLLERVTADFALNGDVVAFARVAQSNRNLDRWVEEAYLRVQGPTAERMQYWLARREVWVTGPQSVVYPSALAVAVDADILGEAQVLQRALLETERLYATLAPDLMGVPETLALHARYLALRGDAAAAVAEIERAIARVPPNEDAVVAENIRRNAVYTLARAGAKDRATEVLKGLVEQERINGVALHSVGAFLYHDKLIRAVLGDDPRYQALMQRIESSFEKL